MNVLLEDSFESGFSGNILVIGDVMVDVYVHGRAARISPEAPVPVLRHQKRTRTVGGAANVAANISSLGGCATLVGVVGQDAGRDHLVELLAAYDVSSSDLLVVPDRCTTMKTRFVCDNQQIMRYDEEEVYNVSQDTIRCIKNKLLSYISSADAVVISDYGKGFITRDLSLEIIQQAKKHNKMVIVDPKGKDYTKYNGAKTITPNLQELAGAVGQELNTDDDVYAACLNLIDRHSFDFVLSTRSEKGMSLVSKQEVVDIPTYAREVYDVSGAGDTVVAAFAVAMASGLDHQSAAYIANAAAGVAVSRRGTARVSIQDARKELIRNNVLRNSAPTILGFTEAREVVDRWKADGQRIGFTNGCFDILHSGHVSILERARSLCDRLVVGLNADSSVKRLKGAARPVNAAEDRAAILNALTVVDAVVVFEDDTPLSLIKALRPDTLFKGADYTVEHVVGAEFVQDSGGQVILLDLKDAHSTTNLIKKIMQQGEGAPPDVS